MSKEEELLVEFMKWLEKHYNYQIEDYEFKARYFLKQRKDKENIAKKVKR